MKINLSTGNLNLQNSKSKIETRKLWKSCKSLKIQKSMTRKNLQRLRV